MNQASAVRLLVATEVGRENLRQPGLRTHQARTPAGDLDRQAEFVTTHDPPDMEKTGEHMNQTG